MMKDLDRKLVRFLANQSDRLAVSWSQPHIVKDMRSQSYESRRKPHQSVLLYYQIRKIAYTDLFSIPGLPLYDTDAFYVLIRMVYGPVTGVNPSATACHLHPPCATCLTYLH